MFRPQFNGGCIEPGESIAAVSTGLSQCSRLQVEARIWWGIANRTGSWNHQRSSFRVGVPVVVRGSLVLPYVLLPDAEATEDAIKNVVGVNRSNDLTQLVERGA